MNGVPYRRLFGWEGNSDDGLHGLISRSQNRDIEVVFQKRRDLLLEFIARIGDPAADDVERGVGHLVLRPAVALRVGDQDSDHVQGAELGGEVQRGLVDALVGRVEVEVEHDGGPLRARVVLARLVLRVVKESEEIRIANGL